MQHLGFEHRGSKLELPSVSSILAQMRRYIPTVHMRGECTRYFTVIFFSVTSNQGYKNSVNHLDGNLLTRPRRTLKP